MICSLSELKQKEIIDITDGTKIGFVDDVEMNLETSSVTSLIVYGRPRFFGLFGREDDYVICWSDIEIIGEDTILVSCDFPNAQKSPRAGFKSLLK